MSTTRITLAVAALCLSATAAQAQKSAADAIADYRASLQDGNPADLNAARGEVLWNAKKGPKNLSLQACDLGLGAGVVKGKGAVAQMPCFGDAGILSEQQIKDVMALLLDPNSHVNH